MDFIVHFQWYLNIEISTVIPVGKFPNQFDGANICDIDMLGICTGSYFAALYH